MKLDLMDMKILYELDMNSRSPLSKIAKKVRSTKQVVKYRIENLVKDGIIKQFTTIIDVAKLGFLTYRIYGRYQNVTPEKEKEMLSYFNNHPNVLWLVSMRGRFDFEVLFLARNFVHFNSIFSEVINKYGANIKDYILSMSTDNFHFRRRYLLPEKEDIMIAHYGGEPQKSVDDMEMKILKAISTNSRTSFIDIASRLDVTSNTIRNKIKDLEKRKVIQGYRIMVNLNKIGYKWYKILITLNNLDENKIKQILSYCNKISNMHYFVRCLGGWELEIELHVENEDVFREILLGMRNAFSNIIRDYETVIIYEEHKLNYFPM